MEKNGHSENGSSVSCCDLLVIGVERDMVFWVWSGGCFEPGYDVFHTCGYVYVTVWITVHEHTSIWGPTTNISSKGIATNTAFQILTISEK